MRPEGERLWERLIEALGPPLRAADASEDELRRAHDEGRVIRVHQRGDGMGSDSVSIHALRSDERLTRAWVVIGAESYADFVFARGSVRAVLDERALATLANEYANSWERWEDIPSLPSLTRA